MQDPDRAAITIRTGFKKIIIYDISAQHRTRVSVVRVRPPWSVSLFYFAGTANIKTPTFNSRTFRVFLHVSGRVPVAAKSRKVTSVPNLRAARQIAPELSSPRFCPKISLVTRLGWCHRIPLSAHQRIITIEWEKVTYRRLKKYLSFTMQRQ